MSLKCILNTLAFTRHREQCVRSCDQSTPCENGSLPCLEYFWKGHGDNLTTVVESRELLGITSFLFSLLYVLRASRGCVASGRETLRRFNASKKKHWQKMNNSTKKIQAVLWRELRCKNGTKIQFRSHVSKTTGLTGVIPTGDGLLQLKHSSGSTRRWIAPARYWMEGGTGRWLRLRG